MKTVHGNSTSPSHPLADSPSHVLSWAGLAGILALAAARCVIAFAPQIAFDTDPAFDDSLFLGMAPAGSMTLDAVLFLACAIALSGEWLSGRGVNWLIMLLALIPAPIVMYHGWNDAGDLWLGSTMLAAAVACATVAHLARDPSMRAVIAAVLIAATIPVFARGIVQVAHEHPQTVRFYEEHKEAFLRDRGWSPDSSAARIYERRLKQPQPTGWFATSNILASLAAFAFVLSAGLSFAALRARMQSGWGGSMILCAALAGAMVWLSGSKGAALALLAGSAWLAWALVIARRGADSRRISLAAIALIALAIVGVVVRGTALPEDFAGDRSLLFRWHYWVAAARMFVEHPLLGVGPDGFQAAYTLHRLPRNPEEVTSAHSVFLDWLAMLGVFGAAWIAMTLAFIGRAAGTLNHSDASDTPAPDRHSVVKKARTSANAGTSRSLPRSSLLLFVVVLVLGILPAHALEWPALDGVGLVGHVLSAAGFMCVAIIVHQIATNAATRIVHLALLAAVTALLVHGQIEMTFIQPGAMVWSMCALGALGLPLTSAFATPVTGRAILPLMWIAAIALVAAVLVFAAIIPAFGQQSSMLQAAAMLESIRQDPANHELMLRQRRAAAAELVQAYDRWPANVHPLNAAAMQLQLASSQPRGPRPMGLLLDASAIIQRAIDAHDTNSSLVIAIEIHVQLAALTADAEHWNRAVAFSRELTRRDPHGISSWRRLGDVLWAAGERVAAADAYRRALQNDANFELDELKRLTPAQRENISNRIKEAESS